MVRCLCLLIFEMLLSLLHSITLLSALSSFQSYQMVKIQRENCIIFIFPILVVVVETEDEWDHMVETDAVEGPVKKVTRNKIVEAMQKMKSGKATGLSEASVEIIVASGKIGVKVMMELFQRVLVVKGKPD